MLVHFVTVSSLMSATFEELKALKKFDYKARLPMKSILCKQVLLLMSLYHLCIVYLTLNTNLALFFNQDVYQVSFWIFSQAEITLVRRIMASQCVRCSIYLFFQCQTSYSLKSKSVCNFYFNHLPEISYKQVFRKHFNFYNFFH